MSRAFEGSAAGCLHSDAVLECGVCWWVYDPAVGDQTWDISAGTAFSDLPEHWRCPSCDAPQDKFMVLREGTGGHAVRVDTSLDARVNALVLAYKAAQDAMVGLPVHNDALNVEAVGFRAFMNGYAGIIVTPWCMNVVVIPADPADAPQTALGAKRQLSFPSGMYTFIMGRMDGIGALETCSLFSPMDEFGSPEDALAAAEAASEELFKVLEEEEAAPKAVTRRFILTRNGAAP